MSLRTKELEPPAAIASSSTYKTLHRTDEHSPASEMLKELPGVSMYPLRLIHLKVADPVCQTLTQLATKNAALLQLSAHA